MALRHFEGVTQRHYTQRLLTEAREIFERLPKLFPTGQSVETYETPPEPDNSNPDLKSAPPALEPPAGMTISSSVDSGGPSGSSTKILAPMPICAGKSVLEAVVETHRMYLEIVARSLRTSDAPQPTRT